MELLPFPLAVGAPSVTNMTNVGSLSAFASIADAEAKAESQFVPLLF